MKTEQPNARSLLAYKILTTASFLLVHITNIHFAWTAPAGADGKPSYRTIWEQNRAHPTPFSLNEPIVDIYWIFILFMQVAYIIHLFTGSAINAAANVGSHFILNNVLMFAFVLCWVHSQLALALVFLIFNFFNLQILYFRHSTTPLSVHIPVVSGPLAWTYVALFWCGAAAVDNAILDETRLVAGILANAAIWGFLGYGLFFVIAFKDWTVGFNLAILTACESGLEYLVFTSS